tara:strand:- start:1827 stop:2135 length:309 start_codon:yes stop_codon:yes gene_type:complete
MTHFTKIEQITYEELEEDVDKYFTEKHQIMKDLPIELQINYDSWKETVKNLYFYYLDHPDISKLPDIFYEDYIIVKAETIFRLNYHKNTIKELKQYFKNKEL